MSFLFGGRSQLSSEQKIAAAETEVEMVSDMFYRSVFRRHLSHSYIPTGPLHVRSIIDLRGTA